MTQIEGTEIHSINIYVQMNKCMYIHIDMYICTDEYVHTII